jgi:hypothetical protein
MALSITRFRVPDPYKSLINSHVLWPPVSYKDGIVALARENVSQRWLVKRRCGGE